MILAFKKILHRKTIWEQERCPHCNALLFEKAKNRYHEGSVRVKCRRCKEMIEV